MEVDLDEVMAATEDEMSSQAESARQRLLKKIEAVQLALDEHAKIEEERIAECRALRAAAIEAGEDAGEVFKKTMKKKTKKMMKNLYEAKDHIIECLMDAVDLMEEVNYHFDGLMEFQLKERMEVDASLRARVATLEQQIKEAKREADSLRVQLHEETGLAESLRLLVAKLEQERDEREERAKKADSLRLQLQEAMEQQLEERANQDKEAKREADSLRVQLQLLQEKTKLAESLHPLVAMLKQERDERIENAKKANSLRLQLQEAVEGEPQGIVM